MKKIYLSVLLGLFALQLSAQTYNGGTWYSLYNTEQHNNVTVTSTIVEYKNIFAPTNGTLNIDYKKYAMASINGNIAFFESSDGGKNEKGLGDIAYSDYKNWKTGSKVTSTNINYIRLKNNSTGVSVKNAKLPLAQHILLADGTYGTTEYTEAFDFGSIKWGETSANIDTIALRSFLTAGNISITSSIPSVFRINSKANTSGVSYKVGANACASANGASDQECAEGVIGDINLYGFRILFCPQEAKTYTGIITITDGTSSATIAVKGTGLKQDQTLTFDPATLIYDTATIAPATASSKLEPTYTFNPENVVAFEGGKFVITPLSMSAQVTITASQTGNTNYNAATSVEKTITINPSKTYGTYTTSVCKGEQVEFDSKQYEAGYYENILISQKNMYGSDSLVTLTVNELPIYTIPESKTMWFGKDSIWHNINLSQYRVGTHTIYDSLKTVAGCDSVYVLTLVVKALPTTYGKDSAYVCPNDSAEFRGKRYPVGEYKDTLKNWLLGDSIVTYAVKALPTYFFPETKAIFVGKDSLWRGKNLSEYAVGQHVIYDSLKTVAECDSVYQLTLTVNALPTTTGVDSAYVCPGDSVLYQENYYVAGVYNVTIQNYLGGDSIVTFTVKEWPVYQQTVQLNAVYGDTILYYNETRTYVADTVGVVMIDTVYEKTINGCDSILYFEVTVSKALQLIVWNDSLSQDTVYLTMGDSILNLATSTQGLSLLYRFDNQEQTAVVIVENTLYALSEATVTVTPYQEGTQFIEAAEGQEKTFVIQGTATTLRNSNVSAECRKMLVNGQLIILNNSRTYNAQGTAIR